MTEPIELHVITAVGANLRELSQLCFAQNEMAGDYVRKATARIAGEIETALKVWEPKFGQRSLQVFAAHILRELCDVLTCEAVKAELDVYAELRALEDLLSDAAW